MQITDLKYKSPNDTYTHNGKLYDLTHLRPYTTIINKRVVLIFFSHHVFSDSKIDGDIVKKNESVRGFCVQRYKQSLQLPDIISKITPNHKFMKSGNNWFFIHFDRYHIYLHISPAKNNKYDYVITIASAHNRQYPESGNIRAVKYIIK